MVQSKKEETLANLEAALKAMEASSTFGKTTLSTLQVKHSIEMIQAHWKESM